MELQKLFDHSPTDENLGSFQSLFVLKAMFQ